MATNNNYKVITSIITGNGATRVGAPVITRSRDESPAKALAAELKRHKEAGAQSIGFDVLENGNKCHFNGTANFGDIEFFIAIEVDDAPQDKLTGLAVGNVKAWMKVQPVAVVNEENLDDLLG